MFIIYIMLKYNAYVLLKLYAFAYTVFTKLKNVVKIENFFSLFIFLVTQNPIFQYLTNILLHKTIYIRVQFCLKIFFSKKWRKVEKTENFLLLFIFLDAKNHVFKI